MRDNLFQFLMRYIISFLFPAMLLFSPSQPVCQPVPDEYMLPNFCDGFKSITQSQCVLEIVGQSPETTFKTDYFWIDGRQTVSGETCWRSYHSTLGFARDNSDIAETVSTFLSLARSELRSFGSDAVLQNGDTIEVRHDPYSIVWKYGLSLGNQFTHTYKTTTEYRSSNYPPVPDMQITEAIRLFGYEKITTPLGNYPKCLKWEKIIILFVRDDQTSSSKLISWNAPNKETVKYLLEFEGGKMTCYLDMHILSSCPSSVNSLQTFGSRQNAYRSR
jgi:hypothetical protein